LTKRSTATLSPTFSSWSSLVASATGNVFGTSLEDWQKQIRISLSLPTNKPIVIVGHQPTFFHPGILAKFIAADRLVKQIDGVLVYLVVDHHKGKEGQLLTPLQREHLTVQSNTIAPIDSNIAMKDQPRVDIAEQLEPFTTALQNASGENAAMQYAHASVTLMSPWVDVHHVITASELILGEFGRAVVAEMNSHPQQCVDAYNNAVELFPKSGVSFLQEGELPLWYGHTNASERSDTKDIRPRAILLTLLARLVACDLFVHGTGGISYDQCMEHWCTRWLGVTPCHATMATATLRIPFEFKTYNDARREYSSPSSDLQTKGKYLHAIQHAAYKSPQRLTEFQQMHRWLTSIQRPPNKNIYRDDTEISKKRDWAFPLYSEAQLNQLYADISAM